MKSSQRLFVAFGLLCSLGFAGAAVAQAGKSAATPAADPKGAAKAAAKSDDSSFIDTVNVSVVNVDVYVTDKKGNAVTGLTKADFQLFENNRPVEISNFYAVSGGKAVTPSTDLAQAAPLAPAAPVPGAQPPVSASTEPDPTQLPEDQKLRLIVYIDNFNLLPFDRNRVMREIRAFIGQKLNRGDQLMLVTFDREMHIRRTFTSDPSLIAAAMLDLEKISAQGVHAESDRRDTMQKIADSRSPTEAETYATTYAQSSFNDLSYSIGALKKMVDALAGMPGRKAVLYVSDGLQMIAGQDVFYAVQNKYPQGSSLSTAGLEYSVSGRIDELAAQANANRITFYTIDAAGLRGYDSNSAENQGPGAQAPGLSQLVDSIRISNLQSTLQTIAEKTGGVAILNSNIIMPRLEKIGTDFNSYYSLGYTPPHFGDGRYYKIEVKVKNRKDLVVRHREGYRDKSTEARMSDGTLAALNFPFEENPLGITLEFGQPRPRDDGFYLVPVLVRIPIGRLVLIPRETTQTEEAKVRLFIAALDDSGGTSDVQQAAVPITIQKADLASAQKKQYVYSVTLLMRQGDQRVSIGVRDDVGAQASFLSRGLRVGSP